MPAVACGLATEQPGVSAVALNEDLVVLAFAGGLVAAWRIADLRP